jgi:peptidoglycan/LPS O-acetylase OafA/YrhL
MTGHRTPPADGTLDTAQVAASAARFPGLDSLRFFAALFVVIGHIPMNQESVGLPHPAWGAFFYRGSTAVSFFFTLSGFLITHLLLEERRRTGDIDIRSFYVRRVLRIWPLYFGVAALGLLVYNALLPAIGMAHPTGYSLWLAVVLYTLFLPNLMNALYPMGGILNPLWSIGVEEQFYLAWAPLARRARRHLPLLAATVLTLSLASFCASQWGAYGAGFGKAFAQQLKFHFMAVGALCAWLSRSHGPALLRLPFFSKASVQCLLWALLLEHYFVGVLFRRAVPAELAQMLFYGWLILEVGTNPNALFHLAQRPLEYLGKISYGIYMLHMPAVYAVSYLFLRLGHWSARPTAFVFLYYPLTLAVTFGLAATSYRYFERPFLLLKERFSRVSTGAEVQPPRGTGALAAADDTSPSRGAAGTIAPSPGA